MTKLHQGKQTTAILLPKLSLRINGSELCVTNTAPIMLKVELYYEEYLEACGGEQPCPEYVDLFDIRCTVPIYFTNNSGITLSLDSRTNMVNILSESQYDDLISVIRENNREA